MAASLLCYSAIVGFGQTSDTAVGEISKCWSFPFGESSASGVSADAHQIYITMNGGKLETVSREGRKVWSADLGGSISSNSLATDNGVIVVTSAVGAGGAEKKEAIIRSLSKETGITQWTARITEAGRHFLHAYNGWIIVASDNGTVYALEAGNGRTVWRREIATGFVGKPVFAAARLAVATSSNKTFTMSLGNGEIEGIHAAAFPASALLWGTDGAVLIGDERGNVTSVRIDSDKPNWRFKSGGQVSDLLQVGSDLVAISYDNFVYSLDERNGGVNWKRRLSGRMAHAAKIGDDHLWLSPMDDNGVIVIDSRNGKVVGQFSFAEDEKLTADPVVSTSGIVVIATSKGAYGFSTAKCPNGNEGSGGHNSPSEPSINY